MSRDPAAPALRSIVVLGLLSTFGPLSLDLYLPALPELADDLASTPSAAQLTITACLVGLALGQLVAGPLSDRFGRRRPLLVGLVAYLLASLACAFAPSVTVLVVLRLVQGLAGAAGLVVARAVARDLYEGRRLVLFFSRLTLISGLAPVVAPVLGGQLSRVMSWRGIFVVLAGFGALLLVAGLLQRETLPAERRSTGGLTTTLRGFRVLLGDRFFVGAALSAGLAGASMFAYISGATFVLQRIYGMSAQGFSLVFGLNSVGIMAMSQLGARLSRRRPPVQVLALGLGLNLLGAAALATTVLLGLGLPFLVPSLFVMVSALGLVFPTATALAMSDYPEQAGTASSLLGLGQFVFGAVVAPLVGIAGEETAVPLGVVAVVVSALASLAFLTLVRPAVRARADEVLPAAPPPA
ncbi:multidrug effflux MFS transporter [Microlunatus capsulatus]|uniref:DHA1 family bicyclomycin/chloramphenicol resistance-like MFS transporter n=1 Tax=Microlunatus capsulatus TaxID=99117 RepID=A0ABS4ZCD7_9ACTN|nr:multidrug effflux MFS transporter [Microlunatus capsulatus]MBP2418669.1 DHA1 family bicyclomycin/chloramphenicol resistance-like MFS transporter [Microlunatus capsulatus]